ncbi:MAG: alanine--tRNA ligase [Candidatus Melainabacteria bacterium]|nr:MAG: alanine--tRNA ligase [Candidatus Melainabacteria bacterium]
MYLSGAEVRDKFVAYFRDRRGHLHLPSSSLIPDNPTLLLTSAGMVQFVPIFLGQAPPTEPPRAVTVQKCARAGGKDSDIENVGRTARHHSFFEMLGNFSFGDYFKAEVIPWAWEFVTKDLGFAPERLSVTIFRGDDEVPADEEAFEIWNKKVGLSAERIFRMSRKDNFWGPPGPTGPCGPCSEIYYDRGEKFACSSDPAVCGIGKCECDRYLEFWNLVFMELFKDEHGKFSPLARKNVDTGLGLDRVALIAQDADNSFETDLLKPILEEVARIAAKSYKGSSKANTQEERDTDTYLKIITDHARCVTFLVADGIRMSNVGRGYVLRFITRRAARFGRLLGITEPFIYKLVPKVVEVYSSYYKELLTQKDLVAKIIIDEEERFAKTIDRGMTLLEEKLAADANEVEGAAAFNLYATYGFPIELTREIARERGKTVDMDGFNKAKKEHETVSAGNKFNVNIASDDHLAKISKDNGGTKFTGHAQTEGEGSVVAILKDGQLVDHLEEGDEAELVLDTTPFYAESGGQLGDTGRLISDDSKVAVLDTKKHEKLHLHKIRVLAGALAPGSKLRALVDAERRHAVMLHHSTAHVFHSAIRELFGKQVVQAGSQVGPHTMRFDFTLDKQPSPGELARIESMMNEWVRSNAPVETQEMPIEEAKRTGAIAMFGEKYGDIVRVVRMGDFSLEFCGGTHVQTTGQIGLTKIISEGSIASGVRRIEAVSGPTAWQYISQHLGFLEDAAGRLKTRPSDLVGQIERLQEQLKQKEKLTQTLEEKLALARVPELLKGATQIKDFELVAAELKDTSADGLKAIAEEIRKRNPKVVVVLASASGADKVSLTVGVSDDLVKRGINAGAIAKEAAGIVGGSGGGRPQIAQAGGKEPAKINEALSHVKKSLTSAA